MKIQNDERWMHLAGGYRTEYDPRPALAQLRSGQNEGAPWSELWNELHHQGDVGEASYAAVPELVKIYKQRGIIHWQTYAMVATIELQRTEAGNPKLPVWLADDYLTAIQELAVAGARDIFQTSEPDTIRAILGLIAIARGLRVCGRLLAQYSEPEIAAMLVSE
ncbi:MAG TPA: hypothetical protein VIY53_00115 [Acidobacteriaceae bacterium]